MITMANPMIKLGMVKLFRGKSKPQTFFWKCWQTIEKGRFTTINKVPKNNEIRADIELRPTI